MMKMNMPTEDAQDCMRELGERSMGNWFENMDKMDIQAERKNTAEARKELDEAKEKLAEAENRLSHTESKLAYAIKYIVDTTKKKSGTREAAIIELEKAVNISKEEAEHLIEKYW